MSADPLRQLGEQARAEEVPAADARWEALALGTLAPADVEALRAEAERSPEARSLWELYAPLGPDFDRRLLAEITRAADAKRPRLVPSRRSPAVLRWVAAGTISAAAAAGAAWWMGAATPNELPAYALEVRGGDRVERGAGASVASPVIRASRSSELDLALRPARAVAARVGSVAWVDGGGTSRKLAMLPDVTPEGTVRWHGSAAALLGDVAPGTYHLTLFVGDASALPGDARSAAALAAGAAPLRVRVASVDVVLAP